MQVEALPYLCRMPGCRGAVRPFADDEGGGCPCRVRHSRTCVGVLV